jgi:hypothetical protein
VDGVRYQEQHWTPAWIVALAFLVPFAVCFGGSLAVSAAGSPHALSPVLGAVYGVAFGVLIGGLIWLSHARRTITVDDRALRVGSRAPILLDEIEAARAVEGPELKHIRRGLTSLDGAELGLPASAFSPAIGELAVGGALIAGRHRRAGMVSPPWMPSAALVLTRTGQTRLWLIGSRHADRLVDALGRGSSGLDDRPAE